MKNTKIYQNNHNIQKLGISKQSRENSYMVSNYLSFSKKKLVRINQIFLIQLHKTTPKRFNTHISYSGGSRFARSNKKNLIYSTILVQSSETRFPQTQSDSNDRAQLDSPKLNWNDQMSETKLPQIQPTKSNNHSEFNIKKFNRASLDSPTDLIGRRLISLRREAARSPIESISLPKRSSIPTIDRAQLDPSECSSILLKERNPIATIERHEVSEASSIFSIERFRSIHTIDRNNITSSVGDLASIDLFDRAKRDPPGSSQFIPNEFFFISDYDKTTCSLIATASGFLFSEFFLKYVDYRILFKNIPFFIGGQYWKNQYLINLFLKKPNNNDWVSFSFFIDFVSILPIELCSILHPLEGRAISPREIPAIESVIQSRGEILLRPIERIARKSIGFLGKTELRADQLCLGRSGGSRLAGPRCAQSGGLIFGRSSFDRSNQSYRSRFARSSEARSPRSESFIFEQSFDRASLDPPQFICSIDRTKFDLGDCASLRSRNLPGFNLYRFVHFDSLYYRYTEFHTSALKLSNIKISFFLIKKQLKCQKMFNRPLLFLNRFDIKQLCQFWNLSIFPDKTNKKLKFRRNRIRKQLLPLLRFFFNRQIDQILYQFSEITLTDKFYLDYLSVRLINQHYKDFQLNQKFNCVSKPSASGRQYSFRLNPVWNSKFEKQNKQSALEPSELLWQSTLARSSSTRSSPTRSSRAKQPELCSGAQQPELCSGSYAPARSSLSYAQVSDRVSDRVEAPSLDLFVSIDSLQRRVMPCIEVFNAKSIRPFRELAFSSSLDLLLINLGNFKNNMNGQKKIIPIDRRSRSSIPATNCKTIPPKFWIFTKFNKNMYVQKKLNRGYFASRNLKNYVSLNRFLINPSELNFNWLEPTFPSHPLRELSFATFDQLDLMDLKKKNWVNWIKHMLNFQSHSKLAHFNFFSFEQLFFSQLTKKPLIFVSSSNKLKLKSMNNQKNTFYNKKFDKFFIYYIPFGLRKRIFRKVFSFKFGN